jgi:hypothetical protein
MPAFDPNLWYEISDQVGPGKLFGSRPHRDAEVRRGLLHPGFLIGNRRKNTGEHLNEYLARCQTKPRNDLPAGFGGAQPGAGRRKQEGLASI